MAAGEPSSITNAPVTGHSRLLLEVPEEVHDPRTVGIQPAKFTTGGSVHGSSGMDWVADTQPTV
jgi:hypothetical protein